LFIPLHDANALRHIHIQWVTLAVIVANSAIWIATGTGLAGGELAIRDTVYGFGFIPAVALEGVQNDFAVLPEGVYPWSTYLTYAFLHGDFWHLLGNMLFIWVFGDNVEDAMGHVRFLVFFLLCAAAGALLHGVVQPSSQTPLIGASGAAAGVITAYLMLHPRVQVWVLALGRIPIRLSALWVIGAWIAFQFVNLAIADEGEVSWAAHVGGIVAGVVLLPLFKRRGVKMFDWTPVDEVLPPVPPPAVADPGWPLPGQPEQGTKAEQPPPLPPSGGRGPWGAPAGSSREQPEAPATRAEPKTEPASPARPIPWGRQPRE